MADRRPTIEAPELTDAEIEDLAITAYAYREHARNSCQLATLMGPLDRKRSRWYVKDAARFMAKSGELDGTGSHGEAS